MTVTSTHKDVEALTLTFVAEFDAPVERVWQVWADPRQLERWWGPPTWPATFEVHDFTVGGRSGYHMTGPEGEKPRGWWRFTAIEAPHRLEFEDGFADDGGEPVSTMDPTRNVVTLEATDGGTRMVTVTTFAGAEQLEQLLAMGMQDGMRLAMGQIDEILAEG
ncbi:SRPBCC domain-containing protein [Actinokineospora sp. NBRC 105648]|uniref:SRPBCC family protein n=1 Tax=Actinokineospora sp. NBRC 105648 TaxID=3032206 RepID=UPI0024A0F1A9|nr:SRPBCC domain-containing protein [Actinokineospora sp. NBRC 105648]GLZ37177.1 activator of HSP90 ATPase [Actinokineospora sp. NBRC 105648]